MHVNVVAGVIENVDADSHVLLRGQALARLRDALGSRQIDRGYIVNLPCSLAADHKLRQRILSRGRCCKYENGTKQSRNVDTFHRSSYFFSVGLALRGLLQPAGPPTPIRVIREIRS